MATLTGDVSLLHHSPTRSDFVRVALGISLWLGLAAAFAASGAISVESRALVPIAILVTLAVLTALYATGGALRRVADGIELRALILLHAARAPIGVGFFVLAATSGLDATFTRVAGWGDLAVGLLAPLASLALPARSGSRRNAALTWNTLAFFDILASFFTAQRALFFSGHPESMVALLTFPGPMLPLVIVPLVIATHVLIHRRLVRAEG